MTTAVTVHPPEFAPLQPRHAPGFDHIVVLMFENRSFDNVLGHLYSSAEKSADKPKKADKPKADKPKKAASDS